MRASCSSCGNGAISPLAEKRGQRRARRGGRSAGAGHDPLLYRSEAAGDGGGGAETLEEAVADLGPEASASLLGAPPRPGARLFEGRAKPRDDVPHLADAGPFERRDRADLNLPFTERRADQPQGIRVIGGRSTRRRRELAIRLVDENEIGELDHTAFDSLQVVAGRRWQDQYEEVDDLGDCRLGLADADRLDQHRVE